MGKIVLGYWNIRGIVERIRLMLEYLGLEYENRYYDGKNQSEWFDAKFNLGLDFPNLPYLIDGDLKMTESWAIMRYLAHKNNNQLYPKPGMQEILCDMTAGVVHDFRNYFVDIIYDKNYEKLIKEYAEALPKKLEQFNQYLADKTWLAGDKLTYVDFALCETLDRHVMMFPDCLEAFKNIKRYLDAFQNLKAIKEYHESSRFHKYPLHNPQAHWGHGPTV